MFVSLRHDVTHHTGPPFFPQARLASTQGLVTFSFPPLLPKIQRFRKDSDVRLTTCEFLFKTFVLKSLPESSSTNQSGRPPHTPTTNQPPHLASACFSTTLACIFVLYFHQRQRQSLQQRNHGQGRERKEGSQSLQDQVLPMPHRRGRRCAQARTQSSRILRPSERSGRWILVQCR